MMEMMCGQHGPGVFAVIPTRRLAVFPTAVVGVVVAVVATVAVVPLAAAAGRSFGTAIGGGGHDGR